MRTGVFLTVIVGVLCLVASAGGTTWYVPQDIGTIQGAIDNAQAGDTVLVSPGIYREALAFGTTPVVVKSTDGPLVTTITNSSEVDLAVFYHSPSATVFEGFTLDYGHIAIWCKNAAPTIRGNVIINQQVYNWAAVVFSGDGWGTVGFSPVTFVNNTVGYCANGGISSFSLAAPVIKNTIIVHCAYGVHNQGYLYGTMTVPPVLSYNDVWNCGALYYNCPETGAGSMSKNPLFALPSCQLGTSSPCRDAGDPDPIYNDPDGTRNDIGALPYAPVEPRPARTYFVPDDYATIGQALANAIDADTILVRPGTYEEHIDFHGKSVVLRSLGGAGVTRIAPAPADVAPQDLDKVGMDAGQFDEGASAKSVNYPVVLFTGSNFSQPILDGFSIDGMEVNEGIHCLRVNPIIINCVVERCRGSYDGGGMWFERCSPWVENCVIRHNRTPISGGGIFVRLGYGYHPAFIGNRIYSNVGGNGGGIVAIEGEGATIARNVLYDNHIDPPRTEGWGAITIRGDNCKVINNTIAFNDGGVTVIYSHNVDVRNNIIVGNLVGGLIRNDYVGTPVNFTHDYNDVWNNNGYDYVNLTRSTHEISVDPFFFKDINASLLHALEDYYLQPTAPCIDAGDPDPMYNDPDGSRSDMGAFSTGIPVQGNDLPDECVLEQNYPNPCNPTTVISFGLPEASHATLIVYNLLGQEVRRLVDADLTAGTHLVEWDGRNEGGASVATGVYLYRLEAGGHERVNKMLMIK